MEEKAKGVNPVKIWVDWIGHYLPAFLLGALVGLVIALWALGHVAQANNTFINQLDCLVGLVDMFMFAFALCALVGFGIILGLEAKE